MKPATYALWFGPAAVLFLGGIGVAVYFRRARKAAGEASGSVAGLSPEEDRRLRRILADDTDDEDLRA